MNFKKITLRLEVSSRGGGIEIALDSFGYEGGKMTAYQNYLGGGMLGRVCSDCNIRNWREDDNLVSIAEKLRMHYHGLTSDQSISYEQNQNMSASAY